MAGAAAVTERWRYAGRRTASGKTKTLHAWEPAPGEDLVYFGKVTGSVVGAIYDVDVSRDGGVTLHGSPRYIEAPADGDDVARGWRTEDAAARHDLEVGREEKRAAVDEEVQAALDVLRAHFAACRSYSAKWSFAQWVAAEVARPVRGGA